MRAGEALMIGSLQLRPRPFVIDDKNGRGCAIGMMNIANGKNSEDFITVLYPWMGNLVEMPCGHGCGPATVCGAMVHLFNEHVCTDMADEYTFRAFPGAEKWTLEQLADWLESVDPTPREVEATPQEAVEIFCDSLVKQ
jgi:hypothetical protein